MTAARDFFFVNRSEQDVPRRPRVRVWDRTPVIEGNRREVRDPENPHQEPEREPQASVHSQG